MIRHQAAQSAGPVLHLAAGNLYGGVETFLATVARASSSRERPLEHHFALFFEGRLAEELRAAGAQVHVLGPARLSRPWTLAGPQWRLRQLLERLRPQALLCHSTWVTAALGPALWGQRWALFCHGPLEPRFALDRLVPLLRPSAVLANSAFTAASVPALLPGLPLHVTGCPVEDRAPREPGVRQAVRRELGVDEDTSVLLQVSRMEDWKGHRLLLEALARLERTRPWVCWVTGGAQRPEEQRYLEELRAQVARYGLAERVYFLGQRADVPRLMAAADMFCQPNLGPEPFGIAFVEALLAGLPVLTTDMGGAREIVDSSCGARVEPRAEAVAAVLERWLEHPQERQALGRAGRERALARYSVAAGLQALEQAVGSWAGPSAHAGPAEALVAALRPYLVRGKGRVLGRLVRAQGEREARVFGYRMPLELSEHIQRHIYLGDFEPWETRQVRRWLRPGMSFVDVGANVGYFTLLACSRVGPQGRVFACEPSPWAFQRLQATLRDNALSQARAFNFALGAEPGELSLHFTSEGNANHTPSMVPQPGARTVPVQVRTLDSCLEEWALERVDLMKVDVEGFEPQVLQGARRALAAGRIAALLCEFNDPWLRRSGSSAAELFALLRQWGFRDLQGRPAPTGSVENRLLVLG